MVIATRRAAIYCRISQDRDGTMLGVERQRVDGERLATARAWELAGVYVDNDLSAYKGRARPEYARLLEDMRTGAVDAVIAWHPDRLHRSPRELEGFIDVVEARGIMVETVTAGPIDLSTPSGRAVARTLGVWGRYESEHKAARTRRKHEELAEFGIPIRGGSRGFGLTSDWTAIVPQEAALIREAVDGVLSGSSLRSICARWNARGIVTTTGGRWQQQPLRRMLLSSRLAGMRELRGRQTAGTWPAIIDAETLERIRAVLLDPNRRTTTVRARRYLLTGFLICGACGARMVARPRDDKVRRYVCATGPMYTGCGKTFILAEPLEDLVSAMVVEAIDSPELAAAIAARAGSASGRDLMAELRRDEEYLEGLARDHYVDRVISRSEFLAARSGIEVRIATARRALASSTRGGSLAAVVGGARDRWAALDFDQRRSVIDAVLERATIGPGRRGFNRFDSSRLEVEWRA